MEGFGGPASNVLEPVRRLDRLIGIPKALRPAFLAIGGIRIVLVQTMMRADFQSIPAIDQKIHLQVIAQG